MPILTQDHIGGTDIPLALFAGPLDPQVAQQPVERLLVGVVLLPAGEVADVAQADINPDFPDGLTFCPRPVPN
jgi:hypothetical protein